MKEALTEVGDFKIGGRIINKVRFADDTAIIVKTQEELQDMVNRLVDTRRKYDMEISIAIIILLDSLHYARTFSLT